MNRIDSNGQFWKKICNWFQSIWNEVKIWAGNTFGAEYTVSTTTLEREEEIIPEPSPVTVKSGVRVRKTSFRRGDSSKPISVYADKDSQNPIIASSAGIKVNISDFTLDISVGLNNTGISGSFFNGTDTKSFGEIANLSELKIGFEGATSIAWDNDKTETAYTNCSANGAIIAAIYALVTTGQCSFRPLTDIGI